MIIRQASLDAFEQMAIASFEDEMVAHCKDFAPTICRGLPRETLRQAIRQGREDAFSRGFTRRGAVQFYLDCVLLFGRGFPTDPQYPWVAEVLARNDFDEEMHKSEALFEKVQQYRQDVAGTDSRNVRGCLRRLLRLLDGDLPVRAEAFEVDMMQMFESLYPEKSAYIGPLALVALLHETLTKARDGYGLTGVRSQALLGILMWFLGHQCDEDPFHPWIRDALDQRETKGNEAACATLETRAIVFFEAYLQELI